jgi:isoleucyl-tRNA synthetase
LQLTVRDVRQALDCYAAYDAAQRLTEMVEGLSNWYVRRSRERFWSSGLGADKLDAYSTLHEALVTIARLIAPFVPFFAEEMYQNLAVSAGVSGGCESVHLAKYPVVETTYLDADLARTMRTVRDVIRLGLSVRTANKLKVRQPLSCAEVVLNDADLVRQLLVHTALVAEELNVHQVLVTAAGDPHSAVTYRMKPNFRVLGPRLGKKVQAVKDALATADAAALAGEMARQGTFSIDVLGERIELGPSEVEIVVEAQPGFAAETGPVGVVVLHTTLSEELIDEGLLRELLSRIQAVRKEMKLDFVARIRVAIDGSDRLMRVARQHQALISRECLAAEVSFTSLPPAVDQRLGDEMLRVAVTAVA